LVFYDAKFIGTTPQIAQQNPDKNFNVSTILKCDTYMHTTTHLLELRWMLFHSRTPTTATGINDMHHQEKHYSNDQNDRESNQENSRADTTEKTAAATQMKATAINIKQRGIYLLPNLLSITSLFAGFYAIVAALKGIYDTAAISIFIAMIMDGLDGRIARLTNTVTVFGAELDSLIDMVSFGVAPALVMYSWALSSLGKIGWLAAFIYVAAGALRLARFNTQIGKSDKRYFQGLSITLSAGLMASVIWLGRDLEILPHNFSILLATLTTLLGVLMVSNIRYRSFKDTDLRNHVSFVVMLIIVVILVLISIDPSKFLFAVFFLYACSGPITTIWELRKKRKARKTLQRQNKKEAKK